MVCFIFQYTSMSESLFMNYIIFKDKRTRYPWTNWNQGLKHLSKLACLLDCTYTKTSQHLQVFYIIMRLYIQNKKSQGKRTFVVNEGLNNFKYLWYFASLPCCVFIWKHHIIYHNKTQSGSQLDKCNKLFEMILVSILHYMIYVYFKMFVET
jgi:hypothetical protein